MTSMLQTVVFEIQAPFMSGPGQPFGVELHTESIAQRAVAHRKKTIESPWVAGTFTVRSVRDQVIEPIALWVSGQAIGEDERTTQEILAERVDTLTSCFDQLQYEIAITVGNVRDVWTCSTADYTVETEQAFLEAQLALIKVQVPRLPNTVRTIL